MKEIEREKIIQIFINNKLFENKKDSALIFSDNGHQFSFIKKKGGKIFNLYIDSFSFDYFLPNNQIQKENKNIIEKKFYKTFSFKPNNSGKPDEILLLNEKGEEERTVSDIYKSKDILIDSDYDYFEFNKNINIMKKRNNNEINAGFQNVQTTKNLYNYEIGNKTKNEIYNKNVSRSQNNQITSNYLKIKMEKGFKKSEYIDEIKEEEIPEYDYINEKIINAEDWI